jgi:hypothetical protein
VYEDGRTIIPYLLAYDMRQSHRSSHLRTRRIIIADFIYLGPDESIGCPRNYFTSKVTIMGHIMQCLHVHTCFRNSLLLRLDAESCALAVFTLHSIEFLPIFLIQDTMFIACSYACFVFGRFRVETQRPFILCEVFVVLFSSNNEILLYYLKIERKHFTPHCVSIIICYYLG